MNGLLGQTSVWFVLDSGASISVVDFGMVVKPYGSIIQKEGSTTAVGANGFPLDVVPVKLGSLLQDQDFIVAKNLSVDCLLGADFMTNNQAILDCRAEVVSWGCRSPYYNG